MENIKQCRYCGKDFEKKPSHSRKKWETMKSCSKSCAKMGHKAWNKGKSLPEEQKVHLRDVLRGRTCNTGRTHIKKGQHLSPDTQFKKGHPSPWKGKKNPYFTGQNNPRWRGGVYPEHLKIRHSLKMKNFRNEIFKRDDYTCKKCGRKRTVGDRVILNIHHIKPFSTCEEFRFDKDNVITLCKECHYKTDTYGKNI
jgi:5-methylcytosine-specific restriction endonuclease McrA